MRDAVQALAGSFKRGSTLLFQLLEDCPDELWGEQGKGFPYWQHLYHTFHAMDFFVLPKDADFGARPCTADEAMFRSTPAKPLSKGELRSFGQRMKADADRWIQSVSDADLAKKHEGCSSRMGSDMTNATVLALLVGHNMYHIGCADTLRREAGLKGVM